MAGWRQHRESLRDPQPPYPVGCVGPEYGVPLYEPSRWCKYVVPTISVSLRMIQAYFDESQSHTGAKVLTVGGFYAEDRQWNLFSALWEEQLADAGVAA